MNKNDRKKETKIHQNQTLFGKYTNVQATRWRQAAKSERKKCCLLLTNHETEILFFELHSSNHKIVLHTACQMLKCHRQKSAQKSQHFFFSFRCLCRSACRLCDILSKQCCESVCSKTMYRIDAECWYVILFSPIFILHYTFAWSSHIFLINTRAHSHYFMYFSGVDCFAFATCSTIRCSIFRVFIDTGVGALTHYLLRYKKHIFIAFFPQTPKNTSKRRMEKGKRKNLIKNCSV